MVHNCEMCGRETAEHDRHVRFLLPDPLLDTEKRERAPGAWLSHHDADTSVMMQIPSLGAFVRALLPVRLTGGHSVTYGVWVAIHPDELQRAFSVWWEPEYVDLELDGLLANDVQPWGTLKAPVRLAVRDVNQAPYCVASTDATLSGVLSNDWDHDLVLSAIPF